MIRFTYGYSRRFHNDYVTCHGSVLVRPAPSDAVPLPYEPADTPLPRTRSAS